MKFIILSFSFYPEHRAFIQLFHLVISKDSLSWLFPATKSSLSLHFRRNKTCLIVSLLRNGQVILQPANLCVGGLRLMDVSGETCYTLSAEKIRSLDASRRIN